MRSYGDLAESLLGRRVFARNDSLMDKENEGKGKWCRGYVESADFSSRQVRTGAETPPSLEFETTVNP